MELIEFENHTEMRAHLEDAAHADLHPLQLALRPGSTWVSFHDVTARIIRFGSVYARESVIDIALAEGGGEEGAEIAAADYDKFTAQHMLYGRVYDRLMPNGMDTIIHKAHVWPVPAALFSQAMSVHFDIDRLLPSGRIMLQEAYLGCRGHVVHSVKDES